MKSRKLHVRTKVVALLASFAALWAFAAYVTLREGVNLIWVSTNDTNVGRPAESLTAALQQERRLSVIYLAGRGADQRTALTEQRARTDRTVAAFRHLAGSASTRRAASALLEQQIRNVFDQLNGLGRVRAEIDGGGLDRTAAASTFTGMISTTFRLYNAQATLDDLQTAREGATLIALSRAMEVLSQEDALLAGVIEAGRFTGSEHPRFVQLVGAQRLLHEDSAAQLPQADRERYRQLANGPAATRLRVLEDLVTDKGRAGLAPPVDAQTWNSAITPVYGELRDLILEAADGTIARAKPIVVGIVIRLAVSVLGLIAVIAAIVLSVTTARALVQQLRTLRDAARELAGEKLPRVVDRLRRGEEVDVSAEAPPVPHGPDAIGQVGSAFNAVQETAIRVAVEQAELRRGVRDVFLSLARRTQALVHRQLTTLDAMERREDDPEELANLFRVDHLATRMRRNAENLIVLSGAVPGRGWRQPVPLVDIVRAAAAEIEDYERVTVLPMGQAALTGRVVGDVIHLLAELIENATSFSPPDTPVHVGGQLVANGFAVEIEDRGLGLSEGELALTNDRLRNPPEFKLTSTARLGLYVVGQLAMRHGIRVRLKESAYGGTVAIVLIPNTLVLDGTDADTPATRARRAVERARTTDGDAVVHALPGRPANEIGTPARAPAGVLVYRDLEADANRAAEAAERRASDARADNGLPRAGNGLPRRVRQANLEEHLQRDPAPAGEPTADGPGRQPEDVRRMLASYQRQTRRGRADAEQVGGSQTERTGEAD
ncbi:sensor histidine kinase [Planosporangium mesophilum]|uniref:histidine kinase n=1 Tax=Planosporangium mesophilum TaxID=689768 RepID=A0A8J3TD06_9ACTN|nr:nitrate- and nitrite sensing domain-containing protein [Planosporangium mesophilum]NJC84908.1 sensor histidine kinase [Planosporangium mesophilum]GII23627.1 histidine kinase [Planosporangium mesophilum]